MTLPVLIGVALTHWLITIAACVLVFVWSATAIQRRFWPCLILSVLAFISSYWGVTHIHIASSQTVNGHLQWRIDSTWFFTASLVASVGALACTLWKKGRVSRGF